MSYQPFLIANYATGYDRDSEPWLLPNDAYFELLDGYVYRGVTFKRDGYSGFATGTDTNYTESRMVHETADVPPATGVIDSANKTFTWTLTAPVTRGSVTITGSNPAQSLTDDGLGAFIGDGTGTINYTTGAVSITFTAAPIAASTVLLTYYTHQGLPVMGVMSFYPNDNVRQLILADTVYVNRYNPVSNRLEDISSGVAYTGSVTDFWSWVNYADASSNPRLLFSNGKSGDVIQVYDGSTVAAFAAKNNGAAFTINARQIFNFRDRLVLFQTIETGAFKLYPRRIRISGTGANVDDFGNTIPGAGVIDIPDNTWFFGAAFNRDDLLVFTEAATWMLKYTGNDVTPFVLEKIDGSRGSAATFSVISYLNRTMAASPRGLIISDGYQVERMDDKIPKFAFDSIDASTSPSGIKNFERCYSGFLDEDRDVYLIYPSEGVVKPSILTEGESDRILITNFEEDNYAIYRIPLSCMGNFQISKTVLWSNLTSIAGFPNWKSLGDQYGNWESFPFADGSPISIGGGHKGEVWRLNDTQSEDNPQKIRNVTASGIATVTVTTDWNNYAKGDYIYFSQVEGVTGLNNRQGYIKSISTDYTTFDVVMPDNVSGTYTGVNGLASRCIPFEATSKKFNPYIEIDKKVRCGWIYFYVSATNTLLLEDDVPVPAILYVDVMRADNEFSTTVTSTYEINCTNSSTEKGSKKWVKIWINQTSRFLQFRIRNNQAGARIQVHAMMPGFQPTGRLV